MIPRIRQVQIQHYKSIDRAVVNLEPFTVLVGPNGAGKSNFIDALVFVQECLARSIETAWERRGGPSIPTRQYSGKPVTFGFRFLLDLAEDITADYSFEILFENFELKVVRERCSVGSEASRSASFEVTEGKFVQEIPGIRPKLSADRLALFAASALDEFRPVYDFLTSMRYYSIEPTQLRKWQPMDSGESLKADGSNASSVLIHLEQLGQHSHDERYNRLSLLLAKAVPGIQRVTTAGGGPNREAILDFIQDIGSDEPSVFLSSEMSDGTLRILGLLLAVLQPQSSSVLLIEEPEATIHPAAVELVTQILLDAAQERQVLITTHSPDILDFKELSDQQIRAVSLEHGHTVIAPLSQASRQAIRERLYTPGELLRMNELDRDLEAAHRSSQQIDLFGEVPASSR